MSSYPLEKYRFYEAPNKIIAVSTYEGKTVRGVATCDPRDKFDEMKGKQLAAARCNQKVAAKRTRRAKRELNKALVALDAAQRRVNAMNEYYNDACLAENDAKLNVDAVLYIM